MLAQIWQIEEVAVTSDEADAFTKAAANVSRHYDITTTQKTLDWIALGVVTAEVFGTRAFIVALRTRERRAENARPVAAVHHLRPAPPGMNGTGRQPPAEPIIQPSVVSGPPDEGDAFA